MNHFNLFQKIPTFKVEEEIVDETRCLLENEKFNKNEKNLITRNRFLNKDPKYSKITRIVESNVNSVSQFYYGVDVRLIQMWGNCSLKGMSHHRHVHLNSLISFVIFLNDSRCKIIFGLPSVWDFHNLSTWKILDLNVRESLRDSFTSAEASKNFMVVFPSWLDHSLTENFEENPRFSISGNLFITGDTGTFEDATFLDFK